MKIALIVGHPNPNSFTAAVAQVFAEEVGALGHEPVLRDLYRANFDPRLSAAEIPHGEAPVAAPDIKTERQAIADADVFAFFYPLWFNAPPAIVVGYVQRVFGMGFGYGPIHAGGNEPLLEGRRMISFTSSGAPTGWLKTEGGFNALRNLFDQHVADVCGLAVIDHIHFGGVTPQIRADVVESHLKTVKNAARIACGNG